MTSTSNGTSNGTSNDTIDPSERLAAYRPDPRQLASEWSPGHVRSTVLAERPGRRLRFVPRRVPISASLATAAAIVALMVGVLAVVVGSGDDHTPAAGNLDKQPFQATQVVPTPTVGPDQFAYTLSETYSIAADGTATPGAQGPSYVAPDGETWLGGTISDRGCLLEPAPDTPSFGTPTQAFIDAMPTTPAALETYLRAHVEGSSSQDEALFVAAGDMLRNADLLATSALRSTYVTVLSSLPEMTAHAGVTDYLGRDAVRIDYVNTKLRPGELASLYFDPNTYQLLEERLGSSGGPTTYNGPSPAYTAGLSETPTSTDLTGAASVSVITEQAVVDSVPADVQSCAAAHVSH